MSLNEVAPPGFGHTKGDKKKGVERGGTAAAFDKARKEGRFKGSKSDMFAIMWAQKNKGDKPHYKPGTDKKYKKYQEETSMPNIKEKDKGAINKRFKGLFKKDIKGTVQGVNELFDIDSKAHKKVQRQAKIRNLAKDNENPNEKSAAERKLKGPKLVGENTSCSSDYDKLKEKIGSKEKHDKPAYKDFVKKARKK